MEFLPVLRRHVLGAMGLLYGDSPLTFIPNLGFLCFLFRWPLLVSLSNLLGFITHLLSGSFFSVLTPCFFASNLRRIKGRIGLSHLGGPSLASAGAPDTAQCGQQRLSALGCSVPFCQ